MLLRRRILNRLPATAVIFLSACGLVRCAPEPLSQAELSVLYQDPLPALKEPVSVFFIGHSLIGRQIPAMVDQLAEDGHSYELQLGWGAELEAHWEPNIALKGTEKINETPRFREAHEALESGEYDVLVLTEKVGIKSSIKYHESWYYLSLWASKALAANPDIRLYLYETWHDLDVEEGWLERIDDDLGRYWEREIIDRAMAVESVTKPIYVIPGGQVMARFVREVEERGGVGNVRSRDNLFDDMIHLNSIGHYLLALTHYAVIYGRSPVGLPHELLNDKNEPIPTPDPEVARLMQEIVWDVVTSYPRTGVAPAN